MFETFKFYQKAILFEFEQEKIYHEVFGIKGFLKFIPRSVVIYSKYYKYLFFINYFIFLPVFVSWAICLHPILLVFSFFKWLPSIIKVPKLDYPQNFYLSLSDIKFFSYLDKNQDHYPEAIVYCSFHKSQIKFNSDLKKINFFNFINFKFYLKAFISSLITPFFLLFSKNRHLMLFTYSSFYWYLTYFVLSNRKLNSIWLSNHYDRWVVLVEELKNVKVKILIQHGQLEYINVESGAIYFPRFTNKLKSISKVYTINENSREYFSRMIDNNLLTFGSVNSKLNTVLWPENYIAKFKILIIGHQNDFEFHKSIVKYFESKNDFDIAYKIHPQQIIGVPFGKIWIVSDSNILPKSDIVISYGSTIDNEIKQLIPVALILNYRLHEKFDEAKAIRSLEQKIFDFLRIEKDTFKY